MIAAKIFDETVRNKIIYFVKGDALRAGAFIFRSGDEVILYRYSEILRYKLKNVFCPV